VSGVIVGGSDLYSVTAANSERGQTAGNVSGHTCVLQEDKGRLTHTVYTVRDKECVDFNASSYSVDNQNKNILTV
jgi:hypothetical protein